MHFSDNIKSNFAGNIAPNAADELAIAEIIANLGEVWPMDSTLQGSNGTPITLTRASTKILQRYVDNAYISKAVDEAGLTGASTLVEGASTNKCINYNFAPDAALTGITQDATVTTTRVHIDTVPEPYKSQILNQFQYLSDWNDYVYKSVNSTGAANLNAAGACGNTNAHSISCFGVSVSGNTNIRLSGQATLVPFGSVFGRVKSENLTPSIISRIFQIRFTDADTIYWLGNQLEESQIATSPIVTSGASGTRAADSATVSTTGFPTQNMAILMYFPRGIKDNGTNQWLFDSRTDAANRTDIICLSTGAIRFRKEVAGVVALRDANYTFGEPVWVLCRQTDNQGMRIDMSNGEDSGYLADTTALTYDTTARIGAQFSGASPLFAEVGYLAHISGTAAEIEAINIDDAIWAVRNG